MGEKSKITWTDDTYNPWRGCTKVSTGCKNCYAERLVTSRLKGSWGPGAPRVRATPGSLRLPIKWNENPWVCDECGTPHAHPSAICMGKGCDCETKHRRRVFMGSLMDIFDPEIPVEWLASAMIVVWQCSNLRFQLLSKRPEWWYTGINSASLFLIDRNVAASQWLDTWLNGKAPENVWMGASVEDQESYDNRIDHLLKIPAKVRFLSCEPLLEKIDLDLQHGCRSCNHPGNIVMAMNEKGLCSRCDGTGQEPSGIDWIIVGGESGPHARIPRLLGWQAIRDISEQCALAGVPCFVKQDTAARPGRQGQIPDEIWNIKQFPSCQKTP